MQKTAYEVRISDWSSDVCSSDLVAGAIYALFNPIPFGFFVAALIFDAIYSRNGDVLWVKAAAWLITLGLIFAILPRLINLFHVWRLSNRSSFVEKSDFWLNLVAISAGIINAFVHRRDRTEGLNVGKEV